MVKRIIKKKLLKKLKLFLTIIIPCLLVIEVLPSIYTNTTAQTIRRPVGDYGVLRSLDQLLEEKEDKVNSKQIENETQNRLDQMKLVELEPDVELPDYWVRKVTPPDYKDSEPIIFESIKENSEVANKTTILEFILDRPLNYWIFTKSGDMASWTQAMMRPTLTDPFMWQDIDLDNDLSNGNEISVRSDVQVEIKELPRLFPREERILKLRGGFGLNITRIPDSRTFPLELYIVKSISYEGENYIWVTGAQFESTPKIYSSALLAETIETQVLLDEIVTQILTNGLQGVGNVALAEVNGPYSLTYRFTDDLTSYNLMAGLIRLENLRVTDINWLIFYLNPAEDEEFVPRSGEIWVDSSNVQAPIDQLIWTSGAYDTASKYKIPVNLQISYVEVRTHVITADVYLEKMPQTFSLNIDYTKELDGRNVTVLDYSASDNLKALNYTSFLFPNYVNNSQNFNCTHVILRDIPTSFHMEMTSDIGRDINTTPYNNPKFGIGANILNNIIVRVANRFYRIGKYLKLAAEGLLELPSDEGYAIINTYEEKFGEIEFYQTSGHYVDVPGNYIAFYNITDPDKFIQTPGPGNTSVNQSFLPFEPEIKFAVSGRIVDLRWANLSFAAPLELEMRALDGEAFYGLFIDGSDYASASLSNVPGYIKVMNDKNESYYTTIDPEIEDNGGTGKVIEEFSFTSHVGDQLMELQIKGIPDSLMFTRLEENISFSTNANGYIEEFNFKITSDSTKPMYSLDIGDYAAIVQEDDFITGSGRITGIKNLTYDSSEDGFFEINLKSERTFQVVLINNVINHTKAKVILEPLPTHFKLQLPGIIKESKIDFPDLAENKGIVGYSDIVFTLGDLGNELIDLMGNMTQNLIESIGNIGFNFSISYELESFGTNLNMIAEIERGGIPAADGDDLYATSTNKILGNSIGWTHGIIMQQDEYADSEILRGHLYLQGMPRKASLSTFFTLNSTNVEIDFIEYKPTYDWLMIDMRNIQNRDVNVFFQKIPNNVDFTAKADLVTNLEIGGELLGDININVYDTGCDFCSKKIGALFVSMHTYEPIQSIREVYISELPSELLLNFSLEKNMRMHYEASKDIEFIYSKLSKILPLSDSWHHLNIILHDLPLGFTFDLKSNIDFDIDDPLPLQGLPKLDIETHKPNTLDIKIFLDGAAVGQRGNFEIFLQDVSDTSAKLEGDSYHIKSEGIDYIRLKITGLPILDNYRLNSLILEAEDLKALEFKVNMLFGVFPFFDMGSTLGGNIEISLDHTLNIFGKDYNAHIALLDLVYEDFSGVEIPVATPIFVNEINSNVKRTQNHILVPAILVSLIITWINNV